MNRRMRWRIQLLGIHSTQSGYAQRRRRICRLRSRRYRQVSGGERAIKRVIAEGDLVVAHNLVKMSPEDRGMAGADIFRLRDGKIVEHWDVRQPVPEVAANDNSMF